MLDQQQDSDTTSEDDTELDTQDTPEGEDTLEADTAAEEAEPELSIVIEGEAADEDEDVPDEELGDKGKRAVQRLRETLKETARKEREAKARVAELEAEKHAKVEPMAKPTLEGCGFDEAAYEQQMREYVKAEEAETQKREAAKRAEEAAQDDYRKRFEKYNTTKAALRVQDYDSAEDKVRETLTKEQQAMLIRNLDDPAKVIYALGRSPKALSELSAIKDHDRFAFRLAKLEGEVKVTTKTPPTPETKLRGGAGGVPVGNLNQQLSKAQKAAEETGDYTQVLALKRQIREAGTKA